MIYKIQQQGITKHAITWRGALDAASSMPNPGPVRIERGGEFVAEVNQLDASTVGNPPGTDIKLIGGKWI